MALPKRFLLPPLSVKPAPLRPMSAVRPSPAVNQAGMARASALPMSPEAPSPGAVDNLPTSPLPPISALPMPTGAEVDAPVNASMGAAGETGAPSDVMPNVVVQRPSNQGVAASGQGALMVGSGGNANPSAGVPVPPTPNSTNETTITSPVGRVAPVPPTPLN